MINTKIARPTDPYSPLWGAYWEQNPHLRRGVGAEGVDDDNPDDDNEPDIETLKREAAEAKRLREENERLTAKSREADKHKKEQERIAREANEKAALAAGDLETYRKSVDEKVNGITAEIGAERDLYRGIAERKTSGAAAKDLASKMAMVIDGVSTADGILPHIARYIGSKVVNGELVAIVLDDEGRETAETLDDLEKRIRKIPHLKPFISASQANGGGRPGGQPNGGNGKLKTRDQVDAMDPYAKAAYFKESGGKYAD